MHKGRTKPPNQKLRRPQRSYFQEILIFNLFSAFPYFFISQWKRIFQQTTRNTWKCVEPMVGLEGQNSILALQKFEPAVTAGGMVWHCQIIKPFRFGEHIHRIIDLFPCIWLWRVSLCFIAKCPWSGSFGWHVKVQNPPKGDPMLVLCYSPFQWKEHVQ